MFKPDIEIITKKQRVTRRDPIMCVVYILTSFVCIAFIDVLWSTGALIGLQSVNRSIQNRISRSDLDGTNVSCQCHYIFDSWCLVAPVYGTVQNLKRPAQGDACCTFSSGSCSFDATILYLLSGLV